METSILFEIDDDVADKTLEGENKAQSVSEKCCNSRLFAYFSHQCVGSLSLPLSTFECLSFRKPYTWLK